MNKQENILDKPFESLTRDDLKKGIQDKFGTLSKFCRITNRQTADFNMLLRAKDSDNTKELLNKAYVDAKSVFDRPTEGQLTDQNREALRKAIYTKCHNISEFCEKNKESKFTNSWVSNVLNGNVTKNTPKVKKLANILNVKFKKTKV